VGVHIADNAALDGSIAVRRTALPVPLPPGPHSRPPEAFPADEYRHRLDGLRDRLRAARLDAALVVGETNRLYYTGFPASNGLLLVPAEGRPTFFTDFRYLEAAEAALEFIGCRRLPRRMEALVPPARRRRWHAVGYEGSVVGAARLAAWRRAFGRKLRFKPLDEAIARQRAVKSPAELAAIRDAVAAADEAFARLLREVRPGMTEWEIRRRLRMRLDEVGEGEAFPAIVASGPNSSRCHHSPSLRRWRATEPLLIDMGAVVRRYRSDMTRVVFARRPDRRFAQIHRAVLEAQLEGIAALRAGVSAGRVDAAARRRLGSLAVHFGHGLGHGIGLDIHEAPALAARRKDVLEAGMVVTVEPGVYLPGVGGIRIEDVAVVTADGCEVLTRTPKDLERLIAV